MHTKEAPQKGIRRILFTHVVTTQVCVIHIEYTWLWFTLGHAVMLRTPAVDATLGCYFRRANAERRRDSVARQLQEWSVSE